MGSRFIMNYYDMFRAVASGAASPVGEITLAARHITVASLITAFGYVGIMLFHITMLTCFTLIYVVKPTNESMWFITNAMLGVAPLLLGTLYLFLFNFVFSYLPFFTAPLVSIRHIVAGNK